MDNAVLTVFAGGVIVFCAATIVYLGLLMFFPEWVGVTGKVALDAEKAHTQGSSSEETGFGKHLS